MKIDSIIHATWISSVDDKNTVHHHYSIAIHEGRIHDLQPKQDILDKYTSDVEINLDNQLLIPGLINTHTHSPMSLMRGLADDLHLMDWLNNHIWPTEQKHVSAEFVLDGSLLACAEMIRSGTTCFNDMYFFPEETARAVEQAGMRAKLGLILIDFPLHGQRMQMNTCLKALNCMINCTITASLALLLHRMHPTPFRMSL